MTTTGDGRVAAATALRHARAHADLLRDLAHDRLVPARRHLSERGSDHQRERRRIEHRIRLRTLARVRWAAWRGVDELRACALLGISPRTVRAWRRRVGRGHRMRGRRLWSAQPTLRAEVQFFLALFGVALGIPSLTRHFPEIPRGDLAVLLWCARQRAEALHDRLHPYRLRWLVPGTVWAIDATQPPLPVDGSYPRMLVLRDLASGFTIDAWPVLHDDAATAAAMLERNVAAHGAPLVLKSDNGGSFVAAETADALARHRIVHLRSPPETPQYNGACEAGIGALATRINHLAIRDGHPARWTCNHVEAARLLGNRVHTAARGSTPEQRWGTRGAIDERTRDCFHRAVDAAQARHDADAQAIAARTGRQPAPDAIRRRAITAALTECGLLQIRSRPVHQLIRQPTAA